MKKLLHKNVSTHIKKLSILVSLIAFILIMVGCGMKETHPCDEIAISDKTLRFGMTEEEVISVLGEPNVSKKEENGSVKLTYSGLSVLQFDADTLELYIHGDDAGDSESKPKARGLATIYGTFPKAYEGGVDIGFKAAYGDFIKDENTFLSEVPQEIDNFFSYAYYCDDWSLSTLDNSSANEIKALYSELQLGYLPENPHLVSWQIYGSNDKDNPGCIFRIDGDLAAIYNRFVK
ncbi:MAG: hypothetical protein J6X48_07965 [Lachnospiraceae bacterium]|nr:hypothetical protein [Lachnospiraceae bacterium]